MHLKVPADVADPERSPPADPKAAAIPTGLLDFPVHDHLIIGRGGYVSLAERGMI